MMTRKKSLAGLLVAIALSALYAWLEGMLTSQTTGTSTTTDQPQPGVSLPADDSWIPFRFRFPNREQGS